MKTFARVTSFGEDEFEIEVNNEYYIEHEHGNLNQELIDEFCDFIEDNLPPENVWDTGYKYYLFQI
jgi:hypothetical protein